MKTSTNASILEYTWAYREDVEKLKSSMRILVLTKRQYMGKDLLDDHFGRFWELPLELTKRGHDVQGLALSYRGKQAGSFSDLYGNLTWHSLNLLDRGLPAIHKYFRYAHRISTDSRPDIVWACSDAFHAILGRKVSEQVGAKCVIDLYDNFESYPATRVPGVLHLFRRVVKAADGITCVSSQLTNYVRDRYRSQAPTLLLENAVRADLFYPRDRAGSRRQLNLPQNARLIGTAGALHKSRAINTLYQAFEILVAEQKDLHLVLAGPRRQSDKIPRGERIHDLGNLPLEIVPHFLSALDVAVVSNRDSLFGRFNFPQKTREIMACRVPLVAAGVGTMNCLLSDHPELCFMPGNPQSLALAVGRQLANPIVLDLPVPAWTDMAKELESFFLKVLSNHA